MTFAPSVSDYDKGLCGIDRVERCLLGTLLVEPSYRLMCDKLSHSDFSSPVNSFLFKMFMEMRRLDVVLAVLEVEKRGRSVPLNNIPWASYIASLLDCSLDSDEAMGEYILTVREAAVARKLEKRERGHRDGAWS